MQSRASKAGLRTTSGWVIYAYFRTSSQPTRMPHYCTPELSKRPAIMLLWLLALAFLPLGLRGQNMPSNSGTPALPKPPGTVQVADNLFMDEAEVANIHWLEYLKFLAQDSATAHYRSQLPDSTVWVAQSASASQQAGTAARPVSYFRYPPMYYYPAVGISYEQAAAYCKWRSAMVNQNFFKSKEFLKKHPELRGYTVEVEYRLPTEQEWQQAAGASGTGPAEIVLLKAKFKNKPINVRLEPDLAQCLTEVGISEKQPVYQLPYNLLEQYYTTEPVKLFSCKAKPTKLPLHHVNSYPTSALGLYNIIGNVAEMTATKGVAKGGSFKTSAQALTVAASQPYQGSQSWLGFRCVASVRIQKKVAGTL
ncbi:formylglycine-generating enzyme family protein [Hymenobacter gelipurpurascens]|nr:SUMF1/EgtB/PvdO family nonheme iron enzyme [Hymenobacter gelipurpurascens]